MTADLQYLILNPISSMTLSCQSTWIKLRRQCETAIVVHLYLLVRHDCHLSPLVPCGSISYSRPWQQQHDHAKHVPGRWNCFWWLPELLHIYSLIGSTTWIGLSATAAWSTASNIWKLPDTWQPLSFADMQDASLHCREGKASTCRPTPMEFKLVRLCNFRRVLPVSIGFLNKKFVFSMKTMT